MKNEKQIESHRSGGSANNGACDIALAKFQLGYYSRVVAAPGADVNDFGKLRLAIKTLADCMRVDQYVELQSAVEKLEALQPTPTSGVDDQVQWFFRAINDGVAVVSPRIHASLIKLADSAIALFADHDPWYEAGVRLGELRVASAINSAQSVDSQRVIECVQKLPKDVLCRLPLKLDLEGGKMSSAQECVAPAELARRLEMEIFKAGLSAYSPDDKRQQTTQPVRGNHRKQVVQTGYPECDEHVVVSDQLIAADQRYVSLEEARAIMPGHPSATSIWRWYTHGVKGVRLETILVAGRRYTTRDAIDRFIAATTAAADGASAPARSPMKRERSIEAAERELGVGG